jgi:hypothetical protein
MSAGTLAAARGVRAEHSDRARDQRTVVSAGTMAAERGVRAEHSDRARDPRTVVSAGMTAAARGVRAGAGMREMQRATFPAAALSDWLRASASSFRWSQTLATEDGTDVKRQPHLLHCSVSTARTMLSKNTARMGTKAKPSGVGERRRLCCLSMVGCAF